MVELLLVIGIIGILAAIVFVAVIGAQPKAKAASIIMAFESIDSAWDLWKVDTGAVSFPRQSDYDETQCRIACDQWTHDEPCLSLTDLFQNVSERSGWQGPYFGSPPKTPFGTEYTYDNDGDTWPTDGWYAGVNLMIQWCSRVQGDDIRAVAALVDEQIDGGDGDREGKIRWSGSSTGSVRLLLDPGE